MNCVAMIAAVVLGCATVSVDTRAEEPQVSRAVANSLKAANDALQAKNYAEVLAKTREAAAITPRTAFDDYVIHYLQMPAFASQNNYTETANAIEAIIDSPYLPAALKPKMLRTLLSIYKDQKNFGKVIQYGQQARALGDTSHETSQSIAIARTMLANQSQDGSTLNSSSLAIAFPEGWQQTDLTLDQQKRGVAVVALNKTTDSNTVVSTSDISGVTDRDVYARSRLAAQESTVGNPSGSEIVTISINGRTAKRFEVTGVKDGTRVTYLNTLVFGQSEVVLVSTWTTAANYLNQKAAFEVLAERVSGIK